MQETRSFKAYTYYLYHIPTGKKYYGSRVANTCDPEEDLWKIYFSSSVLVEALIKQYGADSFQAIVRKTFDTDQEARDWEDHVQHRLKVVEKEEWLNQAYAHGPFHTSWKGRKHTSRAIEKMRGPRPSVSGEKNHFFGKKHTEKTKEKMRLNTSNRGDEWKIKQREAQLKAYERGRPTTKGMNIWTKHPHGMAGKKHSPETKQKLVKASARNGGPWNKGLKIKETSPESVLTRQKKREAHLGKTHTEKSKQKMREIKKEWWRKRKEMSRG
jgi:hypothetical protein